MIEKVGNIMTQVRGVSYKKSDATTTNGLNRLPILRAGNIADSRIYEDDYVYIPKSYIKDKQLLKYGDILIAASSGSKSVVGKAAMIEKPMNASFGAFCKVLRPHQSMVYERYFKYFFETAYYKRTIQHLSEGANINNLKTEHFNNLEIPLPPLPVQKKIAAILDAADAYRQKTKALIDKYDELAQSLFLDMFGDPVRNEKGWIKDKLGNFGTWRSGGTPSRKKSTYFQGDIPWLSSGELEPMYISVSKEHITEKAIIETSAKIVEKGSILLGMYDTAALKSSIADKNLSCNQAIAFSKLKNINTVYVYFALQIGREHFRRLQRGVRQKNLNLSMVKNIEIPVPPVEKQKIFEFAVNEIVKQKEYAAKAITKSEELFQRLLQSAFKGE